MHLRLGASCAVEIVEHRDRARAMDASGKKVGESTVEIGARFLDQRLGLGDLLCQKHLPKNGLRFWFGAADGSTSWTDAAEDGPMAFGYWPTYQVERPVLESDLVRLLEYAGIRVLYETKVARRERTSDGHRVVLDGPDRERTVECRWLVDASGPAGHISREEGLLVPEERVPHAACYGRFEGAKNLDELCGGRPRSLSPRLFSTNHQMHDGYWIWTIPLRSGRLSVGLVYDPRRLADPPRTAEQYVAFLRRHAMSAALLADATIVDFGQRRTFAMRPVGGQIHVDRQIALVGEAGGMIDPFYSSGIDLMALECESFVECLIDERAGRPIASRAARANAVVEAFYEQTIRFVSGRYPSFAAFDLSAPRYRRDLLVYWLVHAWPYYSGEFLSPEAIDRWRPFAALAIARTERAATLVDATYGALSTAGTLRRFTPGHYAFNQLGWRLFPFLRFERQLGSPYDLARARRWLDFADAAFLLEIAAISAEDDRLPLCGPLVEACVAAGIDDLYAAGERHAWGPDGWRDVLGLVSRALGPALRARGATVVPVLTLASLPTLRREAAAWAADEPTGRALAKWMGEPPAIDRPATSPLPRRDLATSWSLADAGWRVGDVDWRSVYEFMATHPDAMSAKHFA